MNPSHVNASHVPTSPRPVRSQPSRSPSLRTRVVTAAAAVTVGAALVATPAGATPAGPAAPAAPVAVDGAAAATVTHLPTGETVAVRTGADGRTSVQVAPTARSGPAANWSSLQVGGRAYVFPAIAKPYLGRVLDPELFDVSGPAAATVPLDLTFPTGTTPAVPGFTRTSGTATTAHGYLTAASARQFGAALLTQWKRDAATGRPAVTSLFGATRISRSGAAGPAAPAFPQVTLVIRVLNPDGTALAGGIVGIINTDDGRKYGGFAFVSGGEARVSVPTGHYSLITDSSRYDPATGVASTSIVTVPDYTVTTNLQRIVLDTAAATVTPSVSTPRPAALSLLDLEWDRMAGVVGSLSSVYESGPGSDIRVAPAPAPTYGSVEWLTHWNLQAAPAGQTPYRYDLSYDDSGAIPVDQHRTVAAAQLGRVDANYYTDGLARLPLFGRTAVYPFQFFIFSALVQQPGPLSRTEYFAAPPSAAWSDEFIAASNEQNFLAGDVGDGLRVHPAGTRTTVDWLRGPLAPGVAAPTDGSPFFYDTACRTANRLEIALPPFVDSTPGHTGSLYVTDPTATVARFTLKRDGEVITRRNNTVGGLFAVPADPSVYEATVETFLGAAGIATSTHAVTTLTFPSGGGDGAALPEGWYCPAGRSATVLPLLTTSVPLPTDLYGTMPLGANTVTFTIAPAPGSPPATVTGATLATSVDGVTFTDDPVTALGGNRFRATITNPSAQAGKSVSLKVSGRTAAGSAITQTVDHAYVVQGS